MNLKITPTPLSGCLTVPASKSMSHRAAIAAALAEGESTICNLSLSEDIEATLAAVRQLGASYTLPHKGQAVVQGGGQREGCPTFDCGESGSTLRFLIPVALALCGGASFTGRGRLMERPLVPYFELFKEKNIQYQLKGGVLAVKGRLASGVYALSGAVSSQFITGLLFALPLCKGDSEIRVTDRLSSRGYVDMTLQALSDFGVHVEERDSSFFIPGGQRYHPRRMLVEGDYSQAAFFGAANFIGSSVELLGLNPNSLQGDRAFEGILGRFKAPGTVCVDADGIPDLVPALAAAAAFRAGEETRFENAGRLRIKESDRIASTAAMLRALGAKAEEGPDGLTVKGEASLPGNIVPVDCQNDHRIAMAAAAASVGCREEVTLYGAECVKKSYPQFWEDFKDLGGIAEEC